MEPEADYPWPNGPVQVDPPERDGSPIASETIDEEENFSTIWEQEDNNITEIPTATNDTDNEEKKEEYDGTQYHQDMMSKRFGNEKTANEQHFSQTKSNDSGSVEILATDLTFDNDDDDHDDKKGGGGSSSVPTDMDHLAIKPSTSSVQELREKFERGADGATGLSLDIEEFYMMQRAQIIAQKQKQMEAQTLNHGIDSKNDRSPSVGFVETAEIPSLSSTRQIYDGNYVSHFFVVHDEHGLLLIKHANQTTFHISAGALCGSDFVTAGFLHSGKDNASNNRQSRSKLLSASRLAATRELFVETGIDARGSLDRLVPANLSIGNANTGFGLPNQLEQHIYFYLFMSDEDFFVDGIASVFIPQNGSPEELSNGKGNGEFVFEKDPSKASSMLPNGAADALVLSLNESNPMYNENVIELQRRSLKKILSNLETNIVESSFASITDDDESCSEASGTGSIDEALDVLTYISDLWGNKIDKPVGNIDFLLKNLATKELPDLSRDEITHIQQELDHVRAWRRKYDGLKTPETAKVVTNQETLQQLLTMKAVLREHKQLSRDIWRLERRRSGAERSGIDSPTQNDEEPKKEIEQMVDGKANAFDWFGGVQKTNSFFAKSPEGRRFIPGGEIYPDSQWEVLQNHPDCHLKNKLVISDGDEDVEAVALVLKAHNPRHSILVFAY